MPREDYPVRGIEWNFVVMSSQSNGVTSILQDSSVTVVSTYV